jgi:hypothetical protein
MPDMVNAGLSIVGVDVPVSEFFLQGTPSKMDAVCFDKDAVFGTGSHGCLCCASFMLNARRKHSVKMGKLYISWNTRRFSDNGKNGGLEKDFSNNPTSTISLDIAASTFLT